MCIRDSIWTVSFSSTNSFVKLVLIAKDTAVDAVPSDFIDADSDADADADASEDAEETKRDRTVIIVPKKRKDRTVIVPRKGSRKSRKRVIVVPDRHSGRSYHSSSHSVGGYLGPGADCTNARGSCAAGLVCARSALNGSDRWNCVWTYGSELCSSRIKRSLQN